MRRLDYFLVPLGTIGLIKNCQILPATFSDHCLIILEISTMQSIRGPGLWKFNVNHLYQKEYVDMVNEIIDYADYRYSELNPANKWEMIKNDVQEATISYSKEKASLQRQRIKTLNNKLTALQKKLAMINLRSEQAIKIIQETND